MAEADRAINEILAGDSQQEKQSKRISHYESVKSGLMDTLKKIDEDEQGVNFRRRWMWQVDSHCQSYTRRTAPPSTGIAAPLI
jgi:hypothetical protein